MQGPKGGGRGKEQGTPRALNECYESKAARGSCARTQGLHRQRGAAAERKLARMRSSSGGRTGEQRISACARALGVDYLLVIPACATRLLGGFCAHAGLVLLSLLRCLCFCCLCPRPCPPPLLRPCLLWVLRLFFPVELLRSHLAHRVREKQTEGRRSTQWHGAAAVPFEASCSARAQNVPLGRRAIARHCTATGLAGATAGRRVPRLLPVGSCLPAPASPQRSRQRLCQYKCFRGY